MSVKQSDFVHQIIQLAQTARRKLLLDDFIAVLKDLGATEINELTHENLRSIKRKYDKRRDTRKLKGKIDWEKMELDLSDDSVIWEKQNEEFEDMEIDVANSSVASSGGQNRKPLADLSRKQILRRTDELYKTVIQAAEDNKVEVEKLLGHLLSRSSKKWVADLGNKIWINNDVDGDKSTSNEIPIETATTIYTDGNFGRRTYTQVRKILSSTGYNFFPAWGSIRQYQKIVSPSKMMNIPEPNRGIYFQLSECCRITVARIISSLARDIVLENHPLKFEIKFGFDGSGGHAIFNQLKNVMTNNMIIAMFCPLAIKDNEDKIIWEQQHPNAATSHRPLMIEKGKESRETCQSLDVFNDDISKLSSEGFTFVDNENINVKLSIVSYMMDRKAADLYTGLGGAYCDLCHYSKEQCLDVELVAGGFTITRDIESMNQVFTELETNDGSILKKAGDYEVRGGQTNRPIACNDVKSVQVLHALLRCFDHFMKLVVHVSAGVFDWSEAKTSLNYRFLENTKHQLQQKILLETGQRWDLPNPTGQGGTTTTGNTAKNLLFCQSNRDVICSLMPENHKGLISKYGYMLSIILKAMNSSKAINLEKYKELCTKLHIFLLTNFPRVTNKHLPGPWLSITPSLHKLLAHSWELIEANGGEGLKRLDESGLEANNKVLRHLRTKLSRKCDEASNLEDVIQRMWLASDPIINVERLKGRPFCKVCNESGHSSRYCKIKNVKLTVLLEEQTDLDSMFV